MRRKLYFGVTLALAIGLVAGGFLLNQIGAQDGPKVEPEKKGSDDLFEILKKKFETKASPVEKPALPLPTAQGPTPPLSVLPPPPSLPGGAELPLPTPKAGGTKPVDAPLPKPPEGSKPGIVPPASVLPSSRYESKPLPTPAPVVSDQPSLPFTPPVGLPPVTDGPMPKKDVTPPPPIVSNPQPNLVPQTNVPALDPMPIRPAMATEPIKLKGSAWSLHVEMVDGRSVVTATVNKRHEFKIVCQSIDLQTVAGCMKAKGKVTITGDCLSGTCDQLILPLHDDRLALEGLANVRIQKAGTDTSPSSFELKGDKLDLRISELQSSTFLESNWRKVSGESSDTRPMRTVSRGTSSDTAKSWTQYGTLRSLRSSDGSVWSLQGASGDVIAYVMARDGGSLDQYVGRTIAVFGAREGDRAGRPLVRVTHIAVP